MKRPLCHSVGEEKMVAASLNTVIDMQTGSSRAIRSTRTSMPKSREVFGALLMIGPIACAAHDLLHTYMGEKPVSAARRKCTAAFLNIAATGATASSAPTRAAPATLPAPTTAGPTPTRANWNTCPAKRRPTTAPSTATRCVSLRPVSTHTPASPSPHGTRALPD